MTFPDFNMAILIYIIILLLNFVSIPDEKDLFLNKFIRFIQKEYQKLSDGFLSTSEADRISTVRKNLCMTTSSFCFGSSSKHLFSNQPLPVGSLLSHAESLVPRFLNEDDVQLLR